jgi:predicted ArsR family transcriptional regulator
VVPRSGPERDDARFLGAIATVTAAFGDPTRRDIFLFLRTTPGATASEVASAFSLHPNVARHHLDRLAAGGYLRVATDRRPQGAGRPSKRFFPLDDDPIIELLTRRDDLMVNLLREAFELLGPEESERMAAKVGEEYGRSLADRMTPGESQRSVRAAMHAIAETLTAHGFDAHAEDHGTTTAVVSEQCPFGDAATTHPVLCAVDRGMVKGLLSGLCGDASGGLTPVVLSSRARGDDTCGAQA